MGHSPSALSFAETSFFAGVCVSVPPQSCHKMEKLFACSVRRERKGLMLTCKTQEYEAEENGAVTAEIQNPTENLLQDGVEETCL